jgi:hypothetical protein
VPAYGQQRVSNELRLLGVEVSPSGACPGGAAPQRGEPLQAPDAAERESRENTTFVLTDEQVRLLERHSPEFRFRHVE